MLLAVLPTAAACGGHGDGGGDASTAASTTTILASPSNTTITTGPTAVAPSAAPGPTESTGATSGDPSTSVADGPIPPDLELAREVAIEVRSRFPEQLKADDDQGVVNFIESACSRVRGDEARGSEPGATAESLVSTAQTDPQFADAVHAVLNAVHFFLNAGGCGRTSYLEEVDSVLYRYLRQQAQVH